MISRGKKRAWDGFKEAFLIVKNMISFPMNRTGCQYRFSPEDLVNNLHPQAYSKHRRLTFKFPYNLLADPGICWPFWPRRNNDCISFFISDTPQRYGIMSEDFHFEVHLGKKLKKIVGERIVIIDHDYFHFQPPKRKSHPSLGGFCLVHNSIF